MNYKKSGEICKLLKITPTTLNRWIKEGKIQYQKINSRKFLYDIDSIIKPIETERINILYSRVSNSNQKQDLKRQTELIKSYMIAKGIIPDLIFEEIASGMNENRKQLNEIIDLIINKKIEKIYITYKDRLTRFGFDYFKNLCEKFNTEIIIINGTQEEDFQTELTQDLISIIHHFSMKLYSNRKKILKNFQQQLKQCELSEEIL